MTPLQREPFGAGSEPFVGDGCDAPMVMFADRTGHAVTRTAHTVRFRVPSSVGWRIRRISEAERRLPGVVMEKVVSDFLSVPVNEPRPYIPFHLQSEDAMTLQWRIPTEQIESLQARASAEGRDVRTLIVRALVDYIDNSPDDPVRAGAAAPAAVGEVPGQATDVPVVGTEGPIPGEEVGPSDDADIPAEE